MKRTLLALFFFSVLASFARSADIKIEIDNYSSDTVLLGYYYWDKQYIKDTLIRNEEGKFRYRFKEDLDPGMYLLIMLPDNKFIQFVIDEADQKFKMSLSYESPFETLVFKGSEENQIFHEYVSFLGEARKKGDQIRGRESGVEVALDSLNEAVIRRQKEIITQHPTSMAALAIVSNEEPVPPEFEGSDEEKQELRYSFYLKHYLDGLDLADKRLPYTAFLFTKIDQYMERVVMPIPDSIINALDRILVGSEANPKAFKLILVHYLNKYASSEFVGMDAVYVHLVDTYYSTGKATWAEEATLKKMMDDADALRPILIGKPAPPITLYDRDEQPVRLYDVESPYTVLVFWAPDCGHCKKSMPKLNGLVEELADEGVTILAVCSKLMDKEKTCWEYVDENGMNNWLNLTDKYLRSKYKQKYNIKSTPQVFILDANKMIVSKKIAIDKLPEVIQTLKKIEAEKRGK